jgi:hypothetical protein
VLIWEGKPTSDSGRQILHGALTWDEPLPVVVNTTSGGTHVIGRIDNIRREETGAITGEVTLLMPGNLYCQADLTNAKWDEPDAEQEDLRQGVTVTQGKVAQIVLGDDPAWPKEEM